MVSWLASPPVAFAVILVFVRILSALFARLAFRPKNTAEGTGESYACGEDNYDNMAQPDYSLFFPFAFFFTLAHVATLIMATVPGVSPGIFAIAMIYIIGAVIGLSILFRR